MEIIQKYYPKLPQKTKVELKNLFIDEPEGTYDLEIEISLEDTNLNLREFSNYLFLIDRFYARLLQVGIYSYAHSEQEQLQITEIKKGSTQIVIRDLLSIISPERVIMFYLLIKYLPAGLKDFSESILNIAHSFESYENAMYTRSMKKNLKRELANEEKLKNFDKKNLTVVAKSMEQIYSLDRRKFPSAVRFVNKYLRHVNLKVIQVKSK